ncbi:MAG: tRNA-binding protein [Mycoplasmataceae bacterium]|jgi:tRNA-binding protein|nr:tRNA-binding protein [Mycoplasmataceae bacterium]
MTALFYNKTSLQDTLIIHVASEYATKVSSHDKFCVGYDAKNDVCFINIFQVSSTISLSSGYLKLNAKLCSYIMSVTKIDLHKHIDQNQFVVGQVISCENIADTHLHSCQVAIGNNKTLDIVCGAKNVKSGIKTVVAEVGAILPNGLLIKPNKLMGYQSFGMLCSARELNLSLSKYPESGIVVLDEHYQVGQSFDEMFVIN